MNEPEEVRCWGETFPHDETNWSVTPSRSSDFVTFLRIFIKYQPSEFNVSEGWFSTTPLLPHFILEYSMYIRGEHPIYWIRVQRLILYPIFLFLISGAFAVAVRISWTEIATSNRNRPSTVLTQTLPTCVLTDKPPVISPLQYQKMSKLHTY